MHARLLARFTGTIGVVGLLAAGLAAPAGATNDDGQASAVSAAISRAERFENQAGTAARVVTAATAGTTRASLPTRAQDGVRLNIGIGTQVSVGLPGATAADTGRTASDGTVVYTHAARSASVAAQALPDGGAQLLVAIDGADAPTEYSFPVSLPAGVQLQPSGDGGYFAKLPGGQVLTIAAPWARDALGKAVPTTYRLDGQTLIQTVAHAGFTYPVVADPWVSFGWKVYVHYSKSEVQNMVYSWQGKILDKLKYASILCLVLIESGIGAGVCAIAIYDVMGSIAGMFNYAAANNRCAEIDYWYTGIVVSWNSYRC